MDVIGLVSKKSPPSNRGIFFWNNINELEEL